MLTRTVPKDIGNIYWSLTIIITIAIDINTLLFGTHWGNRLPGLHYASVVDYLDHQEGSSHSSKGSPSITSALDLPEKHKTKPYKTQANPQITTYKNKVQQFVKKNKKFWHLTILLWQCQAFNQKFFLRVWGNIW